MIFSIGLIVFLVGLIFTVATYNPLQRISESFVSGWHVLGAAVCLLGFILMVISVCITLWKTMP